MRRPVITVLGLCGRSVFLKVDHFHHSGETLHASSIYIEPGGKGYNQAVAAARLGAEVHFFAACGDDEDGRACIDFLISEGIHPHIQVVGIPTAFASILTDKDGSNEVTVYRGSANALSAAFLEKHEDIIAESDIVLLNFEVPDEAVDATCRITREYGIKTILNPAPAHKCSEEYLNQFYCITPNQSEAETLGYETKREVITLGGDGALLVEDGVRTHFPALQTPVKDTTGAGDCFNGALAVAIAEKEPFLKAVQFAQKAAVWSVSHDYVMPSLPYRNQIE